MGIDGESEQRKAFAGLGERFELFPRFVEHGVVVEAPVVAVGRVSHRCFQLFRAVQVIEAVRFEENVFTGKTQVGALHKVVFVTGVFQDIAETDILRKEAGYRRGSVAFERREQRNTALGSDHAGDGVIGAGKLRGVAEIQPFAFDFTQFRR